MLRCVDRARTSAATKTGGEEDGSDDGHKLLPKRLSPSEARRRPEECAADVGVAFSPFLSPPLGSWVSSLK